MPDLKLGKLPNRTPAKLTLAISPDLGERLRSYAALHSATYGQEVTAADLGPYMLESFLDGDREFAKARKSAGAPSQDAKPRSKSTEDRS
jgi:hypothetical protein